MKSNSIFERDLTFLVSKLALKETQETKHQLNTLKDWLVSLHRKNVVKINHSVMELVCAKYLIVRGCEVQIEYPLNDLLTCDLFAKKGYGDLIVEIETGFIPPDHALAPLTYTSARLASKIIRYSSHTGKFTLGVPPHYILPFPHALALPPRERTGEQISKIKRLCDLYYKNPPVTKEEIRNARIQEIYIIDVDRSKVHEIEPEIFLKRTLKKGFDFSLEDGLDPI